MFVRLTFSANGFAGESAVIELFDKRFFLFKIFLRVMLNRGRNDFAWVFKYSIDFFLKKNNNFSPLCLLCSYRQVKFRWRCHKKVSY